MSDTLNNIQARHSTRVPFDGNRPVAHEDLRQILEAGRWAPTAHNMQNFEVVVVDDPRLLEAIGSIQRTISAAFLQENYQQLSFSEEELLRKKVGLLGTTFPPAWRKPDAKPEDVIEPGVPARSLAFSPTLLFVLYDPGRRAPASEGDFLGIISLGCMMENMWLAAQSLGIGLQIVSAFTAGSAEDEVKKLLGIPASTKIAFTIRLGYPAIAPPKILRVRREVEDFTHHNHFGHKGLD
jgi:nitroreductase